MADYPILSHDALLDYYTIKNPTLKQSSKYTVTRYCNEVVTSFEIGGWKKRNRIGKKLILGLLPAFDQQNAIINSISNDEELGLVLSALDYFEFAGYGVVPPGEWEKKGIKHYMLPMTDFTPGTSNESIIAAIKVIRDCIKSGKIAYIHCKAGRSRSAMLCIIYLALYGNGDDLKPAETIDEETIKNLEAYIKKECERKQVELHPEQRKKAIEIIKQIRQMEKSKNEFDDFVFIEKTTEIFSEVTKNTEETSEDLKETLKRTLSSLELKNAIIHLPSFKQLAIHACKSQGYLLTGNLTKHVQAFFSNIYHATNENWYVELMNATGPMKQFVNAGTSYLPIWNNNENNLKEQEALRTGFIDELNDLLVRKLNCSKEDLTETVKEFSQKTKIYNYGMPNPISTMVY